MSTPFRARGKRESVAKFLSPSLEKHTNCRNAVQMIDDEKQEAKEKESFLTLKAYFWNYIELKLFVLIATPYHQQRIESKQRSTGS